MHACINTADCTVRFHILRKFLTDKLAGICAGDKWKCFVGKKTNTPYVGHEGKEAYKKVMEFTNVNGQKVRENNARVELLEREMRVLRGELIEVRNAIRQLAEKQG